MKANSKRFLALCLSASMVFGSVLPVSAGEEEIKQAVEQSVQKEQAQHEQSDKKEEEKEEDKKAAEETKEDKVEDKKFEEKKTEETISKDSGETTEKTETKEDNPVKEEVTAPAENGENKDVETPQPGNGDAVKETEKTTVKSEDTEKKDDKKDAEKEIKEDKKQEKEEFEIKDCTVSVKDDKLLVKIDTDCKSCDGIYIGKKDDKDKSEYVKGEKKKNGGYTFELELELSDNGQKVPVVLHKAGEKGTKDTSWYLQEKQQYLTLDYVDIEAMEEKQQEETDTSAEKSAETQTEITTTETEKTEETTVETQMAEEQVEAAITTLAATADGVYDTTAETGAAMFKVVAVQLTSVNGAMKAKITLSGVGYDYLYMGTKDEAAAAPQSSWIPVCGTVNYTDAATGEVKTGRQYEIPVEDLDKPLAVASRSEKQQKWYDRTITISSANLKKQEVKMVDGTYTTTAETGAAMFKVAAVRIMVKNGVKTARVTLSGTGYDYLYMGTSAEAETAPQDKLIGVVGSEQYTDPTEGVKTGYQYDIPLSAFDTPIKVASRSHRQQKWYDREITFSAANLKLVSADNPGSTDPGNPVNPVNPENPVLPVNPATPSTPDVTDTVDKDGNHTITDIPKNDNKADKESKYESDLSGSTKKVNASTTLADGVYTPDRFSWSGGSGRIHITCNKVTVKNGQAYATIVFSSSAYPYVKANGNKYTGSHGSGTSSFTIPVELNKNNTIIGMTTKMSANHEIQYKIFVYLAVANGNGTDGAAGNTDKDNPASKDSLISTGNKKLDDKAPEIVGLTYESETKVEHAKYFKMYHYENDITLLEIDMSADTARTAEAADATVDGSQTTETAQTDSKDSRTTETTAVSEEQMAESGTQDKTKEDTSIDIYKENIIKYLIYPEGAEIPAGLENDVVLVQKPTTKAYIADEAALTSMKQLKLTDKIVALGWDQTTCTDEDMKQSLTDSKVTFGGTWEDPDLKTLLTLKCDLVVLPAAFLPREDSADGMSVEDQEKRLEDTVQKYALLKIPMIVDRSSDEQTEEAKAEWVKVFGALFDCEKNADALIK